MTMSKIPQQFMRCARTSRVGQWVFNPASTNGFWRYETVDLNILPNASEYTALFEEYKIRAVKFRYVPNYDNMSSGDANNSAATINNSYQVHVCADPNTGILIPAGAYNTATLNTYLAEANRNRIIRGGKEFSVYYKPKVLEDVNQTVSSKTVYFPWTRTTFPTNTARGHHMFIWGNNGSNVGGLTFEVYVTLYLEFRGMK